MIIAVGINHRTSSLETREKVWISSAEMKQFLIHLGSTLLEECFVISTCNRTEIYGVVNAANTSHIPNAVIEELLKYKSAQKFVSHENFYRHKNISAIRHLLNVAAGLDSLVLGDIQILNQIRQQFSVAREVKSVKKILHRLMDGANRVGERVRRETEITSGAVSTSYAAVELALKRFPDLASKSTLLIGAGATCERAAKHISARELGNLYVANRTYEKALELTRKYGGYVVDWNDLHSTLPYMDVIISSVSSQDYILARNDFENRTKQTLIIDLSVPRSIDPAVNAVNNIELCDLDSLNQAIARTLPRREKEIPIVERIITEEIEKLIERLDTPLYSPPRVSTVVLSEILACA
ncbi:MAG: glutamyl-tRNA reductase [Ignavibacteriales bacterium]|nr:glutamyl-tRNA reductase [Ignavibacteriales bacterium]